MCGSWVNLSAVPESSLGEVATLFVLWVADVCPKVCPVGDGCTTKICPGEGGHWHPPGHLKVTNLSCGWGYF